MKNIRISSFIFILISIFLIINFIGYRLLYNNMQSNHEKDTEILFHTIKDQTSDLLAKLIHHYKIEKIVLLQKHKIVQTYLNNHDLNVSLNEIYEKINADYQDKPYNIYITDKNLTIINTSYKDDLGFNLGFAKDTFEKHKSQNIIGCSFPIHENISQKFFSFTDSYLSKNDDDQIAVLQVSYRYMEATQAFSQLKKLIKNYPSVKQAKAYSFVNDHCHDEIFLNGYDTSKPALQEMMFYRKEALVLSNKLSKNNLLEEDIIKDGVHYKLLSMSTTNPIDKDVKVLYTLLLDNSKFYDQLKNLNILITLISLMGIIGIFIMSKVRAKEIKLSDQDNFIQSAMHEIKTPLSIITLNNELRQLEQGTDTYSEEIDSALKVLHNSYRSMSFIMTKDQVGYEIETLDLSEIVKKRIEYFQTIAAVNDKKITFDIDSHCRIDISLIELSRLIDNSLYNAIKYSAVGSPIEVILANNVLSFHNLGKAIENKEKVFNKYFRENKTVGGYGLGLSIIKDIADKYHIDIELQSDTDKGTIFTYIFHYHTNDIV